MRSRLFPSPRGTPWSASFVLAILVGLVGVVFITSTPASSAKTGAAASPGPLDPLSASELAEAKAVAVASPKFPAGAFFPTVTLNEPPKGEVNAWSPGKPFRREAFLNVFDRSSNRLFEVVVDLRTDKVVSWVQRAGLQPPVFATEYADVDRLVRADPRWRKAMHDRGIAPNDVYLDAGWAVGRLSVPGVAAGTRLLRALSFYQGPLPNPYDRPIEGVIVTVDMNLLKVVEVIDSGVRPVNKTITGNADTKRSGLKPLRVVQPDGPSFKVTGNAVEWQGWHFRIGFPQREGLVLSQIGYEQNGVIRPIANRLSLDEIYVPYGIPDPTWSWRAALDIGEYNIGQLAEPLAKNVDVPENAVFFDQVAPTDTTDPTDATYDMPNAVAMYERDAGSLWDRTDPTTFDKDAHFARELVVTAAYPNGNYTYAIEYVFRMDGGIDVHAGSTGTTLNRGVRTVAEGDQYGTSVAENIAAPAHQHFFNFRIDFDVDGTSNRLVEENTHGVPSATGNAFVTDETDIGTEGFRDLAPTSNRHWVVESASRTNALGHPTAYELVPGDSPPAYSQPGFEGLQRAPFAQHPLWVTRYRDGGELFAAGDYPNQSAPGDGLTKYVADHQSVDGRDLVVWYTGAFTHSPAVEDYPVMPTDEISFSLRPHGFFDENPALDAP